MPAYEICCTLASLGVPNATKMTATGEVLITVIRSGKQYSSLAACVKGELGTVIEPDEG